EGRAEAYFEDLVARIPEDIAILWTGPTVRSLTVDKADLKRFRELIGRDPLFWDNTLYARSLEVNRYGGYTTHYPGKVRMCNLFEPFDTYKPSDFQRFNHGAGMYVNGALSGEVYQIKYATVADYLWNPSAYDPERSLWKVLCRDYGVPVARQIIIFNDAYYTFYGTCRRMELEGVDAARIRQGTRQLKHLEKQLQQLIDRMDANHPLVKELSRYCEKQRQRFAKLSAAGK
ncbi:MAG: beta-N-acetylglucosaminidase domain-containing protein, partial [Desulfobacteraceae bacterium]|nr:beta-N-acetylglucosaminidase domain-containing protein [Desulfobacteraceae bacterium]